MKINVKSAPKKFEPKTIEITVESFQELKELREGCKRNLRSYQRGPENKLMRVIDDLYKDALDNGEVDCDF